MSSVVQKRHEKRINDLILIAQDVSPVAGGKVAAAIYIKNKLIALGVCERKTDTFQAKYSKNEDAIFRHAEVSAIKNALRKVDVDDLKSATIYVARSKKRKVNHKKALNTWGLAKPCSGCAKCISDFGIKTVVFTTDNEGVFECL